MTYRKRKISILAVLLIIAVLLFGCGSDDTAKSDTGSKTDSTTTAAVEPSKAATEPAVTTKEAVATDDAVSKKDQADKKSENKTDEKKQDDSKKSSTKEQTKKDGTDKSSGGIKCSISIDCQTLYKKDPELANKVSNRGTILGKKSVSLKKNSTAYDALKATGIGFSGKSYISQINGLSEKDGGKLSGWIYKVNGSVPSVSNDDYILKNGDNIQWRYTCNGGDDV